MVLLYHFQKDNLFRSIHTQGLYVINLPKTSTVKLHDALFSLQSVAVYVTIVSPISNLSPDEELDVMLTSLQQLSVALTVSQYIYTFVLPVRAQFPNILAGQVITGSSSSNINKSENNCLDMCVYIMHVR